MAVLFDFEDGAADWGSWYGTSDTIVNSTAHAHSGTRSLAWTAGMVDSGGYPGRDPVNLGFYTTPPVLFPTVPNIRHEFIIWAYVPTGTTLNVGGTSDVMLGAAWWTEAPADLQIYPVTDTVITSGRLGTWVELSLVSVSPPDTAFFSIWLEMNYLVGQPVYWDDLSYSLITDPSIAASGIAPYGESPYASTLDDLTSPIPGDAEATAYIYENITISQSVSAASMYIYENVTNVGTPNPALFFINPTSANPGDTVFIAGSGLGAFQETFDGKIIFGTTTPLPILWEYVGPSPNAYTPQRQIIPSQQICDPEHELLSFSVPFGASSGYVKVSTSA